MNYKMLVCDLDGTLLDDKHKISKENIEAIEKLKASGIEFVIATGRSIHMLEDFLDVMDYEGLIIWSNGAGISTHEGELLYWKGLSPENVLEISKAIKKFDEEYLLFTEKAIVADKKKGRMEFLYEYNKGLKDEHKISLKIDENLEENLENYKIFKASVSSKNPEKLQAIKDEMAKLPDIVAARSASHLLDLNHKNSSKAEAMLHLAKEYRIRPEEIVAIGDNQNDLPMLEKAGLSITMENAKDEIKDAAMKVTLSNNDSGVAHAINNYIIKNK